MVLRAYEILSDPEKRARYDKQRDTLLRAHKVTLLSAHKVTQLRAHKVTNCIWPDPKHVATQKLCFGIKN